MKQTIAPLALLAAVFLLSHGYATYARQLLAIYTNKSDPSLRSFASGTSSATIRAWMASLTPHPTSAPAPSPQGISVPTSGSNTGGGELMRR